LSSSRRHRHCELEMADRNLVVGKMVAYWTNSFGVSAKTAEDWLSAAFNFVRYMYDISQIKERFGDLSGERVADVGCGWGFFLLLLA
jgi:2-polyprenyl-3-methyl-5-hydroxy-6-metoxy-1,4-benzoquinol methylase